MNSHRSTTYFVGAYVKKDAVVSTRYSQPNVPRTIEDIFGTEHLNLNTLLRTPDGGCVRRSLVRQVGFPGAGFNPSEIRMLYLKPATTAYVKGPDLKPNP